MIWISLQYVWYKLTARHASGHGIHSPFVFHFIRKILVNEDKITIPEKLKDCIKKEKRSKEEMGRGSMGEKSHTLGSGRVNAGMLIRRAGISSRYGELLYRMVRVCKPAKIIELGSGLGISTSYLAMADEGIQVKSVEGLEDRAGFARRLMQKLEIRNVEIICSDFDSILHELKLDEPETLVFIDGNHNYEACTRYFRHFRDQAGPAAILVFDDIHWSPGMLQAWNEIRKDPKVSLSIDIFYFGIVFFRKGINRQHFIIKY